MRNIRSRSTLPDDTLRRLNSETQAIVAATDKKEKAKNRYKAARQAAWFQVIIDSLGCMAGVGQRCMYCSGSECAQVEHYRPKSTHPELAFAWENLLWSCGICNQTKNDRFDEQVRPINPIDDQVWEHFFIDEYGNLCPRWNQLEGALDARAVKTIEYHGLDRQSLQESRQERLIDLRKQVTEARAHFERGLMTTDELKEKLRCWLRQPFQLDIADFFLDGPGAHDSEEPFSWLIKVTA